MQVLPLINRQKCFAVAANSFRFRSKQQQRRRTRETVKIRFCIIILTLFLLCANCDAFGEYDDLEREKRIQSSTHSSSKCDTRKCHDNENNGVAAEECAPGYGRMLVVHGEGTQGKCCDEYECRRLPKKCEKFRCPDFFSETFDLYSKDGKCPEDSYRPIAYVSRGSCCLIHPQCTCRPEICLPAICPAGKRLIVERRGTGRPGTCCDAFRCMQTTSGLSNSEISPLLSSTSADDFQQNSGATCLHNGISFHEGERWHASCQSCSCSGGVALCSWMECPSVATGCEWVGRSSEFECCPTCLGCRNEKGATFKVGERWQTDDCTDCQCTENYQWQCQKYICKTECDNPQKVSGQCCPICSKTSVVEPPLVCPVLICHLYCENGLVKNDWGCYECKCAESTMKEEVERGLVRNNDSSSATAIDSISSWHNSLGCAKLTAETCTKSCDYGFARDTNDCQICKCLCPPVDSCLKHCLYGFEADSSGCPVCKCKKILSLLNSTVDSGEKESNGSCFSAFQQGTHDVRRDDGEWWTDEGYCRQCFCQRTRVYCSLISCPAKPSSCSEEKWFRKKGQCCATCHDSNKAEDQNMKQFTAVCHSPGTGKLFIEGETWKLNHCISCTCTRGHVLCSANECPPMTCEHPKSTFWGNDTCCKECPKSDMNGIAEDSDKMSSARRLVKEDNVKKQVEESLQHCNEPDRSFRIDECTSCLCSTNGVAKCYSETCDAEIECPSERWLMVKGRCCPICSDFFANSTMCIHNDKIYGIGEEFVDKPCGKCSCKAGNIVECVEKCADCQSNNSSDDICCRHCRNENNWDTIERFDQADKQSKFYSFSETEPKTILITQLDSEKTKARYFRALTFGVALVCVCLLLLILKMLRKVQFRNSGKNMWPFVFAENKEKRTVKPVDGFEINEKLLSSNLRP